MNGGAVPHGHAGERDPENRKGILETHGLLDFRLIIELNDEKGMVYGDTCLPSQSINRVSVLKCLFGYSAFPRSNI